MASLNSIGFHFLYDYLSKYLAFEGINFRILLETREIHLSN